MHEFDDFLLYWYLALFWQPVHHHTSARDIWFLQSVRERYIRCIVSFFYACSEWIDVNARSLDTAVLVWGDTAVTRGRIIGLRNLYAHTKLMRIHYLFTLLFTDKVIRHNPPRYKDYQFTLCLIWTTIKPITTQKQWSIGAH